MGYYHIICHLFLGLNAMNATLSGKEVAQNLVEEVTV